MKNVEILQDEQSRRMTNVRKLITRLDSGTQIWIAEDESAKYGTYTTIVITKEGTFTAPADGFVQVIVDIPETTSVTGTENGVTVTYVVNEEGYLVSEEVT